MRTATARAPPRCRLSGPSQASAATATPTKAASRAPVTRWRWKGTWASPRAACGVPSSGARSRRRTRSTWLATAAARSPGTASTWSQNRRPVGAAASPRPRPSSASRSAPWRHASNPCWSPRSVVPSQNSASRPAIAPRPSHHVRARGPRYAAVQATRPTWTSTTASSAEAAHACSARGRGGEPASRARSRAASNPTPSTMPVAAARPSTPSAAMPRAQGGRAAWAATGCCSARRRRSVRRTRGHGCRA